MTPPIASFSTLLHEFKRLPPVQPREPTLLEITGYQRQELLSSNVLAFFLDPASPHGLGTAFLDALLVSVGEEPPQGLTTVSVRTELVTRQGKRLDIVIETDTLVVAIENKIDHAAINPFDEYRAELKRLSGVRPWIGVLLSLRPIAASKSFYGFRPVTYTAYFEKLAGLLESRLLTAREPYLAFARDFMRTMDNLGRETGMDAATLAFFRDHQNDVEQMLEGIEALRADMRQKQQTLKAQINTSVCGMKVAPGGSRPATMLSDMLSYVVDVNDDLHLCIVVHLKPTGWQINLYNDKGSQPWQRQAVETFLRERHIAVRPRNHPKVWRLAYGSDSLPYDAPLAQVQHEVQSLFQQLGGLPQGE